MKNMLLFSLLFLVCSAFAQTSPQEWMKSFVDREKLKQSSPFADLPVKHVGPVKQGGRVVDVDVNLQNTNEFYVGYASGGLWKTVDNGNSFTPIFDNVGALGIGDFALCQTNTNILYVGTGEKNSIRSSYAGNGIFKTTDGGKTWKHLGLEATHSIGRVLIHPQNENIVWVAATGALYNPTPDRGVYKTTDGGQTWTKTLFVNDSTSVIDLVIDPYNPNRLWAATWERMRKAWHFNGKGKGSSIYVSEDGGNTWSKSVQGFPQHENIGRIGLDASLSQKNCVYAVVDNQEMVDDTKTKTANDYYELREFKNMTKETFATLDNKKLEACLRHHSFPKKYTAESVKQDIQTGKYTPTVLSQYLDDDANTNMFNKKMRGVEVYRSDDGGKNWKRTNTEDLEGVYFTYGYVFAEMKIAPDDSNKLYIYGVPFLHSADGGKTWFEINKDNPVHADNHALWINPKSSHHILLGNDGGLYQSYDSGKTWRHLNSMPVGQFYTINYDLNTPYNLYGGLQDNGVWCGSSTNEVGKDDDWTSLFGGDGMYVLPDPRNSQQIITGYQFGNYYNNAKGHFERITPQHDIGEQAYRWNWRTPLVRSAHHPDIVYAGAQKVLRSLNQGEKWEVISPELTLPNTRKGNVPFHTITSLAESPLQFGLLYAGTDDGQLWMSHDHGVQWTSIAMGLPTKWVSSIMPSPLDKATVFVSLTGFRENDFTPYLFKSTDYGKTWTNLRGNLPLDASNVLIQDEKNPSLLFCGLDHGAYVSLNGGESWSLLPGFLNVAAYDMKIHPTGDLIVGTHGRSVMTTSIKILQNGTDKPALSFDAVIPYSSTWGEKKYAWLSVHEPDLTIAYYLPNSVTQTKILIQDEKNQTLYELPATTKAGYHQATWKGKIKPIVTNKKASEPKEKYIEKGKYKMKLVADTQQSEVTFEVK